MRCRNILTVSVTLLCIAVAASKARAQVIFWNEGVNGDLSNNQAAPNQFLLVNGVNSVIGNVNGAGDSQDWLTVTVPAGHLLRSLVPSSYTSADAIAFIGFQNGTAFVGSTGDPASYRGYTHFGTGPGNIGNDILPELGTAAGAQGFTPPLPAGSYTFIIQQLGASTSYRFDYTVAPVPEPTSLALTGLGIIGGAIVGWRRKSRPDTR
jgi:hypothetical protein